VGAPAIVQDDRVVGTCPAHVVPGPGGAQPGPPMPFSAPLSQGLVTTVTIKGRFAAVAGSSGFNTPPHPGLHASDPFFSPTLQVGRVTSGSGSVFIGRQPAATAQAAAACCLSPGQLVPSIGEVLIG